MIDGPARGCLLGLLAAFVGCNVGGESANDGSPAGEAEERPIQVTATVGMVADLVRQVGGARVEVTQLCGTGVDPHLYRATRDDVLAMMEADVIFYCGLMLEGKMADSLAKMSKSKPVVAIAEQLPKERLLEAGQFEGNYDPHVWMDVSAWSLGVDVIVEALAQYDPNHAELYARHGKAYQTRLAELHAYGLETIRSIPAERRLLVTSHDAFSYFGRAYELEVIGVQGISTDSEAGLQRINQLVKVLVDRNIRAVFVESSVPRKNIDALVEGAGSLGHRVEVGDRELFSDAMGPEGTYEGTYIGMMDHNISLIAEGLGGNVPEGGMAGKLSL